MNYILNAYALQDIGHRTNQEDSFYPPFIDPCHYDESPRQDTFYDGTPHTGERLFIVCDGMGGHERGEVASRIVTQTMSHELLQATTIEGTFTDDMLRQGVDEALKALTKEDDPNEIRKMGTTMAMLKFHAGGATVGHIGDSRVYHFRPAHQGHPAQMLFRTEDHTMVSDMVRSGQITYAQAQTSNKKHILSRSMMASQQRKAEPEISHITDIKPGDVFMLCTDGVYEQMDDDALCALLTDPNYNDVERVQRILHECIDNRDNHTAIVVRVQDLLNAPGAKNSSDQSLPAGTVLKSENYTYHIEKVLGQGAFGITYLVNTNVSMQGQLGTIHTGVKVALKEFFMHNEMKREGGELIEISPDSKVKQYADKFRREASKLAMLTHPNIVRVLEVFEANNTIYYSMEYLPDGSLNDYVNKKGGLPEQEAIGCIRRIGSALMYLHTNKMLHLDVKPANIMRSESNDTLKLIDFGLAKRYVESGEAESSANLGFGTSGYAPLEQADASKEHDFSPQLDVYALGATYYKLLTAQAPDNAIDVLNKGLRTMPLVKKNVSQKSIDAIKAAMEPTKAKRLKTVEAFLAMLPRVDDVTIFPIKEESHLRPWHWASIVTLTLLLGLGIGSVLRDNVQTQHAAIEAAPADSLLEIPMVTIEGGTFTMGSDLPDAESDEQPLRQVTVSSFRMSKFEVRQALWRWVMEGVRTTRSKNGNYPVFNVRYHEVQLFIKKLNKRTGRQFRLPTEAEWEFAARGGIHAKGMTYSGSEVPDSVSWSAENSSGHLHPVATLSPNELGLYDMSGNVWELCSDWYGPYAGDSLTDPLGPDEGEDHVIRGGSWSSMHHSSRVTYRQDQSLQSVCPDIGFRLVEDVVRE